MAAQQIQNERVPSSTVNTAPKQYFKGVVKQVMDGGAVVIRGPPRNGPPAERVLALTNIDAPRLARRPTPSNPATKDEPFAWEAREFLRKMVVGKTVLGNVVHTVNRDYGVLLLGEDPETAVNVALKLVEEGLARVRDNCQDKALHDAQDQAKNDKKGMWSEGYENHVRNITWDVENARGLVEKFGGRPISAVVEYVRDGTTLRLLLIPDMVHVTLMMSGVRAPATKMGRDGRPDPAQCEPFAMEAHYFTESRLLQRDVEVLLESNSNNNLVGSVVHPAGNIAQALLKEGMAKCVDWSIAKVVGGPEKYRACEKVAKEEKMRIWKDFNFDEVISSKEEDFIGEVIEVVNGDAIVVKVGDACRKINLSSIRPPKTEVEDGPRKKQKGVFKPLYDIPFMFEAREFLRKMLIGQEVQVKVDYIQQAREAVKGEAGFPEKTCCTVMFDGKNVAEALVSSGLASVVIYAAGNDARSSNYDDLLLAQEQAKSAKKGIWGDRKLGKVKITSEVDNAKGLVDKCAGKPISAVVEYVRDGTTLRLLLIPDMVHVTFMMSGVRAPSTKLGPGGRPDLAQSEPFSLEAHAFTESKLFQRDIEVILESHNNNTFLGSVILPEGNIAEELLEQGMAKCDDWSITKVTGGAGKYRAAEKVAKEDKVRIWGNYKPRTISISEKEREYNGRVVEVVNGDALMVKAGEVVRKIHLASIRPPRLEAEDGSRNRQKGFKPLYDIPFMFEAREFLRKKVMGNQVQVIVDYIQEAKEASSGEQGFPKKTCCTVMIGAVNVAEALVAKGLATVVRYAAGNDERSSRYDDLLTAEQKAEKTGRGMHSKKNVPTHKISDMSGDVSKCKQFLPFLQRAGRMSGLVEFVASGSRFRVYIPRETCIITFLLGGISCAKGARTMPKGEIIQAEPYGDECSHHVKEMVLQRDVEIEVETIDKAGNFIGYLFVDNTNLSIHLANEGFASMHFTAGRSPYANQIKNAEDNAKNAKRRIWTNYTGEEESNEKEEEKVALNEDRKVKFTEVLVTEVTDDGKFYACNVSDGTDLEKLMEKLRDELNTNPPLSGAYQPKKNDLCAAKFVDGQWYRAKVEKIGVTDVKVLYVDYGNRASVPKTDLGSLPSTFQTPVGYAKPYSFALTHLPPDDDLAKQAVQAIKEDLLDKTVKLNVEYKTGGESFVTAHIEDADIGVGLVEDGLLMMYKKGGKKLAKLVKDYEDAMSRAKKNHINIWQYGDITLDDAREFGA